jgi:hypothetical protein
MQSEPNLVSEATAFLQGLARRRDLRSVQRRRTPASPLGTFEPVSKLRYHAYFPSVDRATRVSFAARNNDLRFQGVPAAPKSVFDACPARKSITGCIGGAAPRAERSRAEAERLAHELQATPVGEPRVMLGIAGCRGPSVARGVGRKADEIHQLWNTPR